MKPSRLVPLVLSLSAVGGLACEGRAPAPTSPDEGPPFERAEPAASTPRTPSAVADLIERLEPTVVSITTVHDTPAHARSPLDFFVPGGPSGPRERKGAGTGFIIDGDGYVVTNAHVVAKADDVLVRLIDDRQFHARVVGRDKKLDIALLKLDGADGLPSVVFGESDGLRVGEHVLAVGNPFGLGHTVTMGIVSAKARTIGAGPYDDFIQTDASINPGNSGGPLFNLRGEVVGINTAIRAGADGIGFAIPIDSLKDIAPQLREKGYVERGKLGLAFQPMTPELADALGLERPHGAMVTEIAPGSAAEEAGIRSGDVITGVNEVEIGRAAELPKNVARHPPGSTITVHLLRDGRRLSVKATLDLLEGGSPPPRRRQQEDEPEASKRVLRGSQLEDHPDGAKIVRMSNPPKGLAVGDVIVEVNGQPVASVDDVKAALARMDPGDTALFKIRRRDRHRYVGVPLGD